jgi:hypothetical protein
MARAHDPRRVFGGSHTETRADRICHFFGNRAGRFPNPFSKKSHGGWRDCSRPVQETVTRTVDGWRTRAPAADGGPLLMSRPRCAQPPSGRHPLARTIPFAALRLPPSVSGCDSSARPEVDGDGVDTQSGARSIASGYPGGMIKGRRRQRWRRRPVAYDGGCERRRSGDCLGEGRPYLLRKSVITVRKRPRRGQDAGQVHLDCVRHAASTEARRRSCGGLPAVNDLFTIAA